MLVPLRSLPSLLPTALALALCTCTSEPEIDPNDCAADLVGDWESVNEFSCPLVDPTCTYRHELSFDAMAGYEWLPGDATYAGTYTCKSGMVEAEENGEVVFTATYDETADALELSWDGLAAPEPYRRK